MNQTSDRVKVSIASALPITLTGTLFYLRLTLQREAGSEDELAKLLQMKINEQITFVADNSILLSGVRDGGVYDHAVVPDFNEGTATLDDAEFAGGTMVDSEGTHVLAVTDLYGNVRTVTFALDFTHFPDAITSTVFKVNGQNGTLSGISSETTVLSLAAGLNEREYIKIFKGAAQAEDSAFAGTGMAVRLMDGGTVVQSLVVVVTGDLNGDGRITLTDYVQLKTFLVGKSALSGAPRMAADINGDSNVTLTDFVRMKMHLLKKASIIPMEY
ncbi:MAG: dockerin type I repeat-containing protein [Saccharofermentanales bacterium]